MLQLKKKLKELKKIQRLHHLQSMKLLKSLALLEFTLTFVPNLLVITLVILMSQKEMLKNGLKSNMQCTLATAKKVNKLSSVSPALEDAKK